MWICRYCQTLGLQDFCINNHPVYQTRHSIGTSQDSLQLPSEPETPLDGKAISLLFLVELECCSFFHPSYWLRNVMSGSGILPCLFRTPPCREYEFHLDFPSSQCLDPRTAKVKIHGDFSGGVWSLFSAFGQHAGYSQILCA